MKKVSELSDGDKVVVTSIGSRTFCSLVQKEEPQTKKKRRHEPTPAEYLRDVYGLEPGDLELTPGEFDIDDVNRLADKFNLMRRENMTLERAKLVLQTIQKK